jgi:hypothetical protein
MFGVFHRLRKPPVRFVNRWSTPSEIADACAANRMREGFTPTPPPSDAFLNGRGTLRDNLFPRKLAP